jgi:putative endonuclease
MTNKTLYHGKVISSRSETPLCGGGLVHHLVPRSGMPLRGRKLKKMFTVYILQSIESRRYYIGHTGDIEKRLKRHNGKLVRSTKAYAPWEIVYAENYSSKAEALRREMEIKKYKGGIKFKKLLGLWN